MSSRLKLLLCLLADKIGHIRHYSLTKNDFESERLLNYMIYNALILKTINILIIFHVDIRQSYNFRAISK